MRTVRAMSLAPAGPVQIVTVSREFGAGGSDLARALGERLGWPVLDHDILEEVAARLRLDAGTVESFDEHPPSLLARIASVLIVPQPDTYSFPIAADVPDHDTIARASRRVIEDAASRLPIVVVGHGAQCIFGNRPDAIHVRVIAPSADRISHVAEQMGLDIARATALVRQADSERQAYVQRYFHENWRNEVLYDVQLNLGRLNVDEAAVLVAKLIEGRAHVESAPTS